MNISTTMNQEYAQILNNIVRTLPSHRAEQLVEFARFLEAQILNEELAKNESVTAVAADNARWDELLATDKGQTLLQKLANEALSEYHSGNTKPMIINDKGRIAPE